MIVIKLIAGLEKNTETIREDIGTKTRNLQNSSDKLEKALNEMKNKLEATNARIEEAERRISELEDTVIAKEEAEIKREKMIQEHERRIRDLSDTIKRNNVRIIGVPEEEDKDRVLEGVLDQIIHENFPNLGKEKEIEIQEIHRTPLRRNVNRPSARHIIVKLAKYKDKERLLKAAREKRALTYKGKPIRVATDLSNKTWQARKEW